VVQLQIINKVLAEQSLSFMVRNNLSAEHLFEYASEYAFIREHQAKYGNVPDLATFVAQFPEFEVVEVTESEEYLADKAREEYAFHQAVPLVKKAYEMLEGNAFEAINYLNANLGSLLAQGQRGAIDLVAQSAIREQAYDERKALEGHGFITTGLKELDDLVNGWDTFGESVTIFARPGVGKTWVLLKFLAEAWREGYRVGMYSGEMPANEIGSRFDTLVAHFSNSQIYRGALIREEAEYKAHLKKLREGGYAPFYVITPEDLGRQPSVSDLEAFAKTHGIEVLGIDQYSKMGDERALRGSDGRERLEHISADLRAMALRNHLVVLGVSQSNRSGVKMVGKKGEMPELENIYGADAIGQDSTKVISLAQVGDMAITMQVIKNRGGGGEGVSLTYLWDKDHGTFTYQPSADNPMDVGQVERQSAEYGDQGGEGVF